MARLLLAEIVVLPLPQMDRRQVSTQAITPALRKIRRMEALPTTLQLMALTAHRLIKEAALSNPV
jgi:hypothetical protein